jgi:hypothetical protein
VARYFFDLRDNDQLFPDSEGTALGGLDDARQWAFGALSAYI